MQVFKRSQLDFGGAFTADRGLLTFAGGGAAGISPILGQNLNLVYAQQMTRLYEVADGTAPPSLYVIGGRSQGTLQMARVVGPGVQMEAFYERYGDVCMLPYNSLNLQMQAVCGDPAESGKQHANLLYALRYCLLTQIGLGVNSQDLILGENHQLSFNVLHHASIVAPATATPSVLPAAA